MGMPKGISAPEDCADQILIAGMAAGSRVRTLEGELPVEYLVPGDRIVTRAGARRLVSISVRQARALDTVRVRASTLGHDRPESDLLLGPGQKIVVRDWRAKALYGVEVAAVPATRLADGELILRERQDVIRLFTLRFAEDEVIWAEGLELACPAVGAALPATVGVAGSTSAAG
jgi:Hint domain